MAEIFPDEGLDFIFNAFARKTVAVPDRMFLGLFTSQTASTVPARNAVLATQTGVTEVTGGGYARTPVEPSEWSSPFTSGSGRRIETTTRQQFAESIGAYSAPANGFFLATALIGGVAIFYANFDNNPAAPIHVLSAGYTPEVIARWQSNA